MSKVYWISKYVKNDYVCPLCGTSFKEFRQNGDTENLTSSHYEDNAVLMSCKGCGRTVCIVSSDAADDGTVVHTEVCV